MATIRISAQVAEQLIFGFAAEPVRIDNARFDWPHQEMVLTVSGAGLPDDGTVRALCVEQQNRAGQRFTTMSFEPVEGAPKSESSDTGLTHRERAALAALVEAWSAFLELPAEHDDDVHEFRHILHAAQDKILSRPVRRAINRQGGL